MMEKVIKYLTGPTFIASGVLWIENGHLGPGICFLVAGALFCWVGYDYYRDQGRKKKDGSSS